METLTAIINSADNKKIAAIYHSIIKNKSYWTVRDKNEKDIHNLCESFDQAVKYSCKYLGLIYYK